MDVFKQTEKIRILITQDGLVPALKEVADSTVAAIEVHCVGLIQPLHDFGQRNILRLDQKMDVLVHKNIGIDAAAGTVLVYREEQEVLLEVYGILEYPLLLVAARNDVIEGAGILNARFSRHSAIVVNGEEIVDISCFKSDPIWT